jgi:hypothetical protein
MSEDEIVELLDDAREQIEGATADILEMVETIRQQDKLLRECLHHVNRQQFAGVHEQDREDAMDLYSRLRDMGYSNVIL